MRNRRSTLRGGVALGLLLAGCGAAPGSRDGAGTPLAPADAGPVTSAVGPRDFLRPQGRRDRETEAAVTAGAPGGSGRLDVAELLELIASAPREAGAEAVRALSDAATTAALAELREEAVFALGDMGGADGEAAVMTALSDPDPRVREAAVRALARQGGDAGVRALEWALAQAEPSSRTAIVDAIGRIGGPASVAALQSAVRHPDPRVREAAADWLDDPGGASPAGTGRAILRP